eukprot:Opistho-2@909
MAEASTTDLAVYGVGEDGKNKDLIVCVRCGSKILQRSMSKLVEKELTLPPYKKRGEGSSDDEHEVVRQFWHVTNMFDFENMGFSHTVGTLKYLACADCDVGPLGLHDTADKTQTFLAAGRVKYIVQ